jgi:hypothetical protein
MEQWARDWLEGERTKDVKRLEIKVKGRNHYIYESTTHWDNVIKKRVKTSRYIGKLDQEKGLIKSRSMNKFDDVQAPGSPNTAILCCFVWQWRILNLS